MISDELFLDVKDLVVEYGRGPGRLRAVDAVSFAIRRGETLAIIGESGSGKSSIAHALAGLVKPSGGTITRHPRTGEAPTAHVIFQDPTLALNSHLTVWACVAEPMAPTRLRIPASLRAPAVELLRRVGLGEDVADRRPAQLSGGQRQRVTIARAVASKSALLLCDEPVASLDVSLQADVLELLAELRDELGLTYLFISHDLGSVRQIADRVAVMYMGRLAEIGSTDDVLDRPTHPYTQALLAATPNVTLVRRERRRALVRGEIPDPRRPPSGCRFRTRCPLAVERCSRDTPELPSGTGHVAACHFTDQAATVWSAAVLPPTPEPTAPVEPGPMSSAVNSNHR